MKPAQPAEPTYLTSTLLMGTLWATPADLASLYYKTRIFSFAGMLPVTVYISIKHCNETPSLKNNRNKTTDLSICKSEFFCDCGNNHHLAATNSFYCVSVSPFTLFKRTNGGLWQHFFLCKEIKMITIACTKIMHVH